MTKGGKMDYKCPLCGNVIKEDLQKYVDHTERHIVDIIREKHPDWAKGDTVCHKCIDYYRKQIKGS